MKVIFLDHQGVMYNKVHQDPGKLDFFDLKSVKILNKILTEDLQIIISSDWRYWVSFEEMSNFYINQGIKKPLGYLPKLGVGSNLIQERSIEILNWLDNNLVDNWVAIDDMDMRNYLKNFIWCENGLNESHIKEISNFLK